MHEGQPITYASRALTPAETRYSQIEKELLAQVFGLEYNHMYTYGRKVILWTDHKPLVSISLKPLSQAPKRLQRLLLALHNYDVDIRYKPGKEMYLADTLSRAYLNTEDSSQTAIETEMVNMVNQFRYLLKVTQTSEKQQHMMKHCKQLNISYSQVGQITGNNVLQKPHPILNYEMNFHTKMELSSAVLGSLSLKRHNQSYVRDYTKLTWVLTVHQKSQRVCILARYISRH